MAIDFSFTDEHEELRATLPAFLAEAGPDVAQVILDDLAVPSALNVHILVAMERFGMPQGTLESPVPWQAPTRIGISSALKRAAGGYFGPSADVATGFIQRKVARQAYEYEKGLQKGEYIKVGVNKYTDEGEDQTDVELHEYNEQWAEQQISNLKELRRTRDNREVSRTLKDLEQGTRAGKNVMPLLVDCCRAYATVGEMTGVFRDLFGEWQEPSIF